MIDTATEQQRVSQAIARTKKGWCIFMAATLAAFFVGQFPVWNAVFLVPLGIFTYFSAIAFTILTHTREETLEEEFENPILKQIHEDLKNGKLEPGSEEMFERMKEAGVEQISPIGEVSDNVVGKFNGHDIYEWIEIQNPANEKFYRFMYYGPGQYDENGIPVMPEDGVLSFAHVNGVVYSADLTNLK